MPTDHTDSPNIGDYVFATKWSDGDPGDPWALGLYAGTTPHGRHLVSHSNGTSIRPSGFRRVARIRKDVGTWLLNVAAAQLELSPPGMVSMWGMLTSRALDVSEEEKDQ